MITPFSPFGTNPYTRAMQYHPPGQPNPGTPPAPGGDQPIQPPEKDLPRACQYLADYSGCGFWRMLWPEHVLNAYQQCVVNSQTTMVLDPRYYQSVGAVRIQRQATANQLKFVEFLKDACKKTGTRVIYEIDDIIFREDIPDYNKFKPAFESDEIRESSVKIMQICDEITVSCQFMKDYYIDKTGNKKITIIPNCPPKFWIGNLYDEQKIRKTYQKTKARPRILYPGSGAHFDVDNRVKGRDDFHHVVEAVIRTRQKFKWVFIGAFPNAVKPYVQLGEMEFYPWHSLYDYPALMERLEITMVVAPLLDSVFNRAKSDVKYIEASALGLPIACQDMCTYENASIKFETGDEMVEQISRVCGTKKTYFNESQKALEAVSKRWLELPQNYGMYRELFTLPYGHKDRKLLNAINGINA